MYEEIMRTIDELVEKYGESVLSKILDLIKSLED
jgi:hypothetical protein